mgnify:CR=1 FL=1
MDSPQNNSPSGYRVRALNISPSEYVDELYEIAELQRANYIAKQRLCATSITPPLSAWTRVFEVSEELRIRRSLLITRINLTI